MSWKNLTENNAEYKFYNSISHIVLSCIKSLYGSFNLIIESYLKPEKSISQLISGGNKDN